MGKKSGGRRGRPGVGCVLLAGLMLLAAGCFMLSVTVGGRMGLLRDDPAGVMMLGGLAILVGVVLIVAAVGRRR